MSNTLGELCTITKGLTGIQKAIAGEYPLVVTAEERKTHIEYQFDDEAVVVPLVSGTGHGHASINRIHYQTGKFALGSILCAIIPKDKSILNAEYLFRFLNLNKDNELVARMRGMANVTLPIKEIAKIEIPLPSLDEQIKFVRFYKRLEINSSKIDLELLNQLSILKSLRQIFLAEAIQGKLFIKTVEDNETGQQLLESIRAEKQYMISQKNIKIGKLQEPELQANLIFDIPQHWTWCNLDDVCTNITDGTHQTPIYKSSGKPFISAQHVKPFKFTPDNKKYISEEAYLEEFKNKKGEVGDLLVTRVGAIGEAAVIDKDFEFAFYVSLALLKPFKKLVSSKYLAIVINSPYGNSYSKGNVSSKGSSAGNFNLGRIRSFKIPLPPLAEQNAIVLKLEELFHYCDDLETNVLKAQLENDQLLQQVLKEALEPKVNSVEIRTKHCTNSEKTILAGHIINKNNDENFGRVKFQKLLHLTEYHCKIDLGSNFIKKVAGPHDEYLIKTIEADLKRFRFYDIKQSLTDNHKVSYLPLAAVTELNQAYENSFKDEASRIDKLLSKFEKASLDHCEIVSTLYAVWNNRLIKKESFTDDDLKQDFLDWDTHKIKYKSRLDSALQWMRKEGIIPNGWGKLILRKKN